MPSVSAHIAATLATHVTDAFGVMGNGNAYLLDALARTSVQFTPVRHEAAAVVSADAYYRASGRLAVATMTYGAGFTNTATAIVESARARIPVLLVAGDAPTTGLRDWDVDQPALATVLGAPTIAIGRERVVEATIEAIDLALSTRGPVVLGIPYDLAEADAGAIGTIPKVSEGTRVAPTPDAVAIVADALSAATRPLLLAGRGAHLAGAGRALGRVAGLAGALTTSTALGRGIFPDSRFDLGVAGGFGQDEAMHLARSADVVVVFGASLNQFTTRFGDLFGPDAQVIQIDITDHPTHRRVNQFIHADALLAADAIADELARRSGPTDSWRHSADLTSTRRRHSGDGVALDGRLDPRSVAVRLEELLPADRVVVSDGGHFIGWANTHWSVAAPDRMVMVGTAFQSIGLGLGSVPGAARARPDSTIVLTTGDGGGLMALADLESAVRVAGGRGVAVFWNDAAYGAEVTLYGEAKGLDRAAMLIPETDFAALGAALGAEGVVVRQLDDLDRLSAWAVTPVHERRFLVLDCRISGSVIAPYQQEIIAVNTR